MLSRELMGVLALGIVWVTTLLVIGAAWQNLQAIRRLARRLERSSPTDDGPGLVEVESGPEPIAVHRVEQVGRSAADSADARSILFSDRTFGGEVLGGIVEREAGSSLTVSPASGPSVEVWPDPEAVQATAACPDGGAFEGAYAEARKARGFTRTVLTEIGGPAVWIAGRIRTEAGKQTIGPDADGFFLVSARDPRANCARRSLLLAAFIAGVLVAALLCTGLALWPPAFGLVSTLGGAACLAYFLLVQPAGTAVKGAVRSPMVAYVRGTWVDPRGRKSSARIAEARP